MEEARMFQLTICKLKTIFIENLLTMKIDNGQIETLNYFVHVLCKLYLAFIISSINQQ